MSFHSVLDRFHSVLDRLANGELGWAIVLMLWATELAIVLSLILTVRHARALEVDLQEARRSIVSLRNSVVRISRELRSHQDEFRDWRQPPAGAAQNADSASLQKSHPSAPNLDHPDQEDVLLFDEKDVSMATSPANLPTGDDYSQILGTPRQVEF